MRMRNLSTLALGDAKTPPRFHVTGFSTLGRNYMFKLFTPLMTQLLLLVLE
jgi:hypothetical protein